MAIPATSPARAGCCPAGVRPSPRWRPGAGHGADPPGRGLRLARTAGARRSSGVTSAISARTSAPEITTSTMVKDVWMWPRARMCRTGRRQRQRLGVGVPSSRRGSNSAVTTTAGGGQRACPAAGRPSGRAVGRVRVVVPEPPHESRGQDVALRRSRGRRAGEVAVGDRGEQQLAGDLAGRRRRARAGGDGRHVAAGAPAGDGELPGDAAELGGVGGDPLHARRTRRRPPPGSGLPGRAGSRPRR